MPTIRPSFQKAIVTVIAILTTGPAQAEPEGEQPASQEQPKEAAVQSPTTQPCAEKHPWHCGVPEVNRSRALELYAQANQFFDDTSFQVAVERYRAALAYWNHPGIQYNLMLALVVLDQPIEAYQASMEALRYGVKALKLEEYRRALDYQRLLRGRVAYLEVTCDEPDAVVSLDGKDILYGPGTVRTAVRPGQHELVAKKAGYLTTQHSLVAVTEKPAKVQMRLLPQSRATIPVRRWSNWQPWAVVGAGVGLGVAGGLFQWRADVTNRTFRNEFEMHCSIGCPASKYNEVLRPLHEKYIWNDRIGRSLSVAGGIAAITGLTLIYLNREQRIPNPERQNLIHLSITPSVAPSGGELTLNMSF